jgi:RecA-family ATPase
MTKTRREQIERLHPVVKHDPDKAYPPEVWLMDNLWLGGGKINGLFGAEKSGKSRLLCWLIACMFAGRVPFPGGDISIAETPSGILYMRGEETEQQVNERIRLYAAKLGKVTTDWPIHYMTAANYRMEFQAYSDHLLSEIKRTKSNLVIMEPVRRLHGASEDKADEMSKIHNMWRAWTDNYGIDILLTHHTGKLHDGVDMDRIANWGRGSSDLAAILDTATLLRRLSVVAGGGTQELRLKRGGRYKPLPEVKLFDNTDEGQGVFTFGGYADEET